MILKLHALLAATALASAPAAAQFTVPYPAQDPVQRTDTPRPATQRPDAQRPDAQRPEVAVDATALKAAATDERVRQAYEDSGWKILWPDTARAALKDALSRRDRHGLDHVAFLPDDIDQRAPAAADIAYTQAALDYADALARGRVDPASLHAIYTLDRPAAVRAGDLVAALNARTLNGGTLDARTLDGGTLDAGTLDAGTLDAGTPDAGTPDARTLNGWLESLAPQDADYRRLADAYRAASNDTAAHAPTIAATASLHPGKSDPRVHTIAQQLVDEGYLLSLPADAGTDTTAGRYAPAIVEAVRAMQRDYGIAADGIVGPQTVGVLNIRPEDRARALSVALERRRWLSRTPPPTRIDVNTAAAELRYYRDGVLVDTRKVIVGEPGRETPPLGSPIYRLVANPTWTIPKSIQTTELANVDAAYLAAHNMRMQGGWIVQQPGPNNALGLVKFDMVNDQAIYLHDTSAPALFDRSQRHLSHGCVRVEDALGFARMLADQEGVGDAWTAAQESGDYTIVDLPHRIPVRLLYHNAFVDDLGRVAIRADPYGWNDPVATQLGFADGAANRAKAEAIDIGP